MTYYFISYYVVPICLSIVAVYFFSLAVLGAVNKSPVLVPWKLFVAVLGIGLFPLFIHSLRNIIAPPYFGVDTLALGGLAVAGIPLLIVLLWFAIDGYIVSGIRKDPARKTLIQTLEQMKLTYKDEGSIRLDDYEAELHPRAALGCAATLLQVKGDNPIKTQEIIGEFKEQLKLSSETCVLRACIEKIIGGLLVGTTAVVVFCIACQCCFK